jgi:TetR/AcrR family transcriptional regulator, cholesterol catabolism regulator
VAAAAGIGTGTLFLYFPTKEDLLVAVFRVEVGRAWDDAFASVDPDAPLLEQVLQAFGSVVAYHEGDPGLARSFFKELQFVSDPIADGVRQFMRGYFRALEALLAKATERGELMPDVSTRTLASNLYAAWYTLIQRRHAGHLSLEDLHMRLRESFELQLRGITVPKRTPRPRSR